MEKASEVPVCFHQPGIGGGRIFTARLVRRPAIRQGESRSLRQDDWEIVIILDENQGAWSGREYSWQDQFHGRFSCEQASPLAGKLFRGSMEVEGLVLPPQEVFAHSIGCLEVRGRVSTEQRELLFEACLDVGAKYTAGASIMALFAAGELEERTGRKTFLA